VGTSSDNQIIKYSHQIQTSFLPPTQGGRIKSLTKNVNVEEN
jgi:hypothetical protein